MEYKSLFLLMIFMTFAVIGGCESPTKAEGDIAVDDDTSAGAPTTPIELYLKVGETAKTSLLEVTVFSVVKDDHYTWVSDITGDEMDKFSAKDKMFYLVDVEIKNIGMERAFLSATTFSMTDSNNYKYDPVMYIGGDRLDLFKELYLNQRMRGKVVFELPSNAKNIKLVYDFGDILLDVKLASWDVV